MYLLCSAGVHEDGFEILSNMCGKDSVNDDLLKQGVVQLLMQCCFGVANDKSGRLRYMVIPVQFVSFFIHFRANSCRKETS